VYVKSGLPEGSWDVPTEPVRLDQKNCEFTPRVIGVMAGQPVKLGNADAFLHNVSSPEFNQAFMRGAERDVEFADPGVMVTIKCDVHPWMRAYAGVVEHPYFAVTKEDGAFEIPALPDGEYVLAAWHEKLGTVEAKVSTTAAAPGSVDLSLAAK
jgi:plastocyanin